MTKLFRVLVLLLVGLPTVSILAGCGSDDTSEEETVPTNFVSANPPSGSTIAANGSIVLTFDNAPSGITVSPGTAVPSGKKVVVNGPFIPGPLNLMVTWADGTQIFTYTVTGPDCWAPLVTGGSIKDGDINVDPEAINNEGRIEITFSEDVSGNIALQTEGGEDVGWLGKVEGHIGILELTKGREISNEKTYVVVGKVSDAAGQEYMFKITFTTRAKA